MTAISELGEQGLLRRIRDWVGAPESAEVALAAGDDAAVFRARDYTVVSADTLVEGIDFETRLESWYEIGRKAAAANLSDLAAMGATPVGLLVSLSLPRTAELADVESLFQGLTSRARVLGGDLSEPPKNDRGWTIAVTALGQCERYVPRSGARAGDLVCVTGTLGDSALALERMLAGEDVSEFLRGRHVDPTPRLEEGVAFARHGAHAMIDISDGLLMDLERVLEASGTGATIRYADVPRSPEFKEMAGTPEHALSHGEDFELLAAVTQETLDAVRSEVQTPVTVIGEVRSERGLEVLDAEGEPMSIDRKGWQHYDDPTR